MIIVPRLKMMAGYASALPSMTVWQWLFAVVRTPNVPERAPLPDSVRLALYRASLQTLAYAVCGLAILWVWGARPGVLLSIFRALVVWPQSGVQSCVAFLGIVGMGILAWTTEGYGRLNSGEGLLVLLLLLLQFAGTATVRLILAVPLLTFWWIWRGIRAAGMARR